MTCRHLPGDPKCSSYDMWLQKENDRKLLKSIKSGLGPPQPNEYEVMQLRRLGSNVVMMVKYPSCKKCSYEGSKVLVFLDASEIEVMNWREIDPHFRSPDEKREKHQAPSPAARFPASDEGWNDAIAYAMTKKKGTAPTTYRNA